ncbi:hypothetical protein DSO57_1032302 [Entomophthora muscae]|uniref:Uncharacterized protein n=1 Tax=Entomophthora muscae TaxID=34485 RepID=A0ACC2S2I7_9FUNG|nr:hypothetical protein DSO57_1032302 [Entomophthora muscae]
MTRFLAHLLLLLTSVYCQYSGDYGAVFNRWDDGEDKIDWAVTSNQTGSEEQIPLVIPAGPKRDGAKASPEPIGSEHA